MLGAGWLTTGAGSTGVGLTVCGVVDGVTEATDTGALGLALCLGCGLGRGRSDAFSGANCETNSLLTLWGATCGVTAATGVTLATGVAARAGVSWLTDRATRNAAPNAATMQIKAVPAKRTVK